MYFHRRALKWDSHIGEKEYSQKGPNSAAIGENLEIINIALIKTESNLPYGI